jgi:lipopolysaccharide/colanic/teichoic acid biosynthesis glycosyltransferase
MLGEMLSRENLRGLAGTKVAPVQRLVDCLILLLLLPVLLPVVLLIAAVVFVDSPGSVFYRATRIGLNGQPFRMLKFRTMKSGSKGPGISTCFDERFTPVGRFLARTRLDELPNLWNVIKGEMRIVGPRPEDPEFVRLHDREYRSRPASPGSRSSSTSLTTWTLTTRSRTTRRSSRASSLSTSATSGPRAFAGIS